MNQYLIKIQFRYLAHFLLKWNEAGRPLKTLTINGRTQDRRLVGIFVKLSENDFDTAKWLVETSVELGFSIENRTE